MKRVLIVKTGSTFPEIALRSGDFEDWVITGTGAEKGRFIVADVVRGEPLPPADGFAGILVTGSHSMVTDRSSWSERTAAWLRETVTSDVPVLAICYGHQLLAHALGGEAGDNPSGREFGTVEITLRESASADPLFAGLPETMGAHVCHAQSALTLPPGATLLASSLLDPHQAFRTGKSAWGVQFHPEFNEDTTREYIQRHRDLLKKEGQDPASLLKKVSPTPYAASLLTRFVSLLPR